MSRTTATFPGIAAVTLLLVGGCGVTRLQTARTVPSGETQLTVGAGAIHSGQQYLGHSWVDGGAPELMVRHGATDQVDWGVRTFLAFGLLADAKWNLLPSQGPTALAIAGGLGGAIGGSSDLAKALHVPLTITASHTFAQWFTPYVAVGYSTYWISHYGTREPGVAYAARTGTGDGLAMLHIGIELARASGRALLLEYAYARPVVDDPGDFYGFAANHFLAIAFHTGATRAHGY
jgi:hypothetical protein